MGRGRGTRRPGAAVDRPVAHERAPDQRVGLCAGGPRRAPPRGGRPRAHELLTRAQRLRPRLTYALPHLAIQTRVELARAYWPSPTRAELERCCARSMRCSAGDPTWDTSPPRGRTAHQPDDDARGRPGRLGSQRRRAASDPVLRNPPLLSRDRRAPLPIAPHREIAREGHLPQARRDLPRRRRRARPRARIALASCAPADLSPRSGADSSHRGDAVGPTGRDHGVGCSVGGAPGRTPVTFCSGILCRFLWISAHLMQPTRAAAAAEARTNLR